MASALLTPFTRAGFPSQGQLAVPQRMPSVKSMDLLSGMATDQILLCFQQLEEKLKGQADYEEVKKELK